MQVFITFVLGEQSDMISLSTEERNYVV
jgi:hypothetical protein